MRVSQHRAGFSDSCDRCLSSLEGPMGACPYGFTATGAIGDACVPMAVAGVAGTSGLGLGSATVPTAARLSPAPAPAVNCAKTSAGRLWAWYLAEAANAWRQSVGSCCCCCGACCEALAAAKSGAPAHTMRNTTCEADGALRTRTTNAGSG